MNLANSIKPALNRRGSPAISLIFEEATDGLDSGREGRVYPVICAPILKSLNITKIAAYCCGCIGAFQALELGSPIVDFIPAIHAKCIAKIGSLLKAGI